jgi:hypothetical protein
MSQQYDIEERFPRNIWCKKDTRFMTFKLNGLNTLYCQEILVVIKTLPQFQPSKDLPQVLKGDKFVHSDEWCQHIDTNENITSTRI